MAIRFHGSEGGVIESKRLVKSLHPMLDRPELADLVIPDLAKWEDWSVMDKLFNLYKTANEKNSWVRVPVVNYLRACPLPKAKELLAECEKIDPAAVKRANTFFPGAPSAPSPPADKATRLDPPAAIPVPIADGATFAQAAGGTGVSPVSGATGVSPVPSDNQLAAALNEGARQAAAVRKTPPAKTNLYLLLGVPWGVGLALFAAQWSLLRRR
jgi:hypothetical protein